MSGSRSSLLRIENSIALVDTGVEVDPGSSRGALSQRATARQPRAAG
jgi:hypothetical protein